MLLFERLTCSLQLCHSRYASHPTPLYARSHSLAQVAGTAICSCHVSFQSSSSSAKLAYLCTNMLVLFLCWCPVQSVDVTMSKPTGTSSLAHVVGISSSATAARMKPTNTLTANLFNGQMVNYWNLWDFKSVKVPFADGGECRPEQQ